MKKPGASRAIVRASQFATGARSERQAPSGASDSEMAPQRVGIAENGLGMAAGRRFALARGQKGSGRVRLGRRVRQASEHGDQRPVVEDGEPLA